MRNTSPVNASAAALVSEQPLHVPLMIKLVYTPGNLTLGSVGVLPNANLNLAIDLAVYLFSSVGAYSICIPHVY
jgi:hypothetical protein